MKTRYGELSIRISTTITDREHIFRWRRTHPSHERFSRREWVRRGGTAGRWTASPLRTTGRLKEPESARLRAATPWAFEMFARTVLHCTGMHRRISFTRLRQGRKLLELCGPVGGMTSAMDCTEFSVGTIQLITRAPITVYYRLISQWVMGGCSNLKALRGTP